MTYFSPYLHLLESRSQLLLLAILLGCLLGSAPLRATGLPMAFVRFIDRLGSKLDRAHRSTATLVYRGMIALILLLVPEAATQRHLEILSEIAEMLSDRDLRERMKAAEDAAALHKLISDWQPLKSVA